MKNLTLFVVLLALAGVACQNKKGPNSSYGGSTGTPIAELKTVYFDFDDSTIRSDQVSILDGNAQFLKGNSGVRTNVEGHCDERGTNEYNLALGDRRAKSTKNYLVNLGVDPARLNTISFGEEKPVCSGHDEGCWWQNRRSAFVKQ